MSEPHTWSEHAAAYALGALDSDERAAFEAHVAECDECRSDVASYRDAAGLIGYGAPVMRPPPHLRERVLAQAKSVRPIAPPRRSQAWLPWLAAAASLVVAIGALVLYGREYGRRTLAEAERNEANANLTQARSRAEQQDSLLAAVLSPTTESATLVAQGRPPSVRLYRNRQRNVVVVAAHNLPPAAVGRTYQLWGIADGQPVSLGTFNTGRDGRATVALPVSSSLDFQVSAVTDEPVGGSRQPTTTPFIVGEWTE